jgi:hypothetical protein
MEDQFDEELRDYIRKVFEDNEDPSASEGWSLLRKKFPAKKRRRAVIWIYWSAAAVLLLFIGIGLWRYNGGYKPGLAGITKPKAAKGTTLMAAATDSQNNRFTLKQPAKQLAKQPSERLSKQPANQQSIHLYSQPYQQPIVGKKSSGTQLVFGPVKNNPAQTNANNINAPALANTGEKIVSNGATNIAIAATGSSDTPKRVMLPATSTSAPQIASNIGPKVKQPATPVKRADTPSRATMLMFAQNTPEKKKDRESTPIVRLGVYAATYYSYADGSSGQGNLGAGVTAELRLTKHLKLVSGLGINRNSLIFNNSIPTSTAQSNTLPAFYSVNSNSGPALSSAASYSSKDQLTVASIPDFKNYDASLYAIDIPVNLKYEFSPKLYIMTGVSSGTYINETYTYKYNYLAVPSPNLQQTRASTSTQNFNSYYFGKIVNFAFGFGYPVGRNNLIIEPFLKYPLDGLGTQNIRFGSGGINFKFNFPTGNK